MPMKNRRTILSVLSQNSFTLLPSLSLSMKLDDNNYFFREQIMIFIMAYRFKGFINGSLLLPNQFLDTTRTALNSKFDTWI